MPTMRILMIAAIVAIAVSAGLPSVQACAVTPRLADVFPEIAALVGHFDVRMRSPDASVRQRVQMELTYFHPRDSKLYPPFFRYLLNDESPAIRWSAINHLRQHGVFLSVDELPESFNAPIAGLCRPSDPESLKRIRAIAAADPHSANAGWAVTALAVAKDQAAIDLLGPLTDSENVFVRFSAALAYLELGRPETGLGLLRGIAETDREQSGYYKLRAAEQLVRSGETEYLGTLIAATSRRSGMGYADAGISILEDLTGEYFPTPEEWSAWWQHRRAMTSEGCR